MCKTPKQRAGAGAPASGEPAAQDVILANSGGTRVTRSSLVSNLGFKRRSNAILPEAGSTGDGLAARAGFG